MEKLKREGWDINRPVKLVSEMVGVNEREIHRHTKRSKLSQARSLIAYFGHRELGISCSELAKYFGISKSSVSEAVRRGHIIAHENEYRIA